MPDLLDDILPPIDSAIASLKQRIIDAAATPDFAFNMQTRVTLSQLRVLMNLPSEGQVIEELARRALPSPNGAVGYETACFGCGKPITVKRRPIPGKHSWCDGCKANGEPAAQRARDYRQRQSGGGR